MTEPQAPGTESVVAAEGDRGAVLNPQPKKKPYRNPQYLAFIRSKPCGCGCGAPPPSDPHHIRRPVWGAGTGIKPHDYVTVPRARKCHQAAEERHEYYLLHEIVRLLMEYIENLNK